MVNTYICFQCLSWPEKSLQSKKFEVQKKKRKRNIRDCIQEENFIWAIKGR